MKETKIDKFNMINDIVLTLSLIISVIITELILNSSNCKDKSIPFFILNFVLIKITYNKFSKFVKLYYIKKGIRE